MQTILTILLCLSTLLIQAKIHFLGSADIILALLVAIIAKKGENESLYYFFGVGFFQDALSAQGFINTFVKTFTAVIANILKNFIVLEPNQLCMAFAAILTPISIIASLLSVQYFQHTGTISFPWLNIIYATIVNVFLSSVFYKILCWIDRDGQ